MFTKLFKSENSQNVKVNSDCDAAIVSPTDLEFNAF